ncbi:MAG: hypothetical protein H6704_21670 [Myxococcales bacterium]|nr:hypothetical protein [Myxococcales bacterium]
MRFALFATITALTAPAAAQDARRLRHEYVPPGFFAQHDPADAPATVVEAGEPVPAAVQRDGARLEAPGPADPAAPVMRPPDAPPSPDSVVRPDEALPDRNTTQDEGLKYHAMFNPTVAPLRRNVAFDRVEPDYRLTIAPGPRTPVPLSPRTPVPGRELFWGDVTVDATPGRAASLPSVAPDMRILAARTEPEVGVAFEKDAADNFYVRADHRGPVRVVFLVDADARYFAGDVPGNVPLGARQGAPGTALPPNALASGQRVLEALGVRPTDPFDQGLGKLVAWFRGFAAGPPPPARGDLAEDLALGQVGVCRHRSLAFIVAARAAGVPTRVVHNEAHAFVEVQAPDGSWRRIDLGGEAPSLDLAGGEGRRLHTPPPDAFPKPERYLNQYSAMVTRGAPPGDGGDQPTVTGAPPGWGRAPMARAPRAVGVGRRRRRRRRRVPARRRRGHLRRARARGAAAGRAGRAHPRAAGLPAASGGGPGAPTMLRLADRDRTVEGFRGEDLPLVVQGHLLGAEDASPVPGVKVQVYLVGEGAPVPVGEAVTTGADGSFASKLRLPATLPLGRYRVVAASAGDARYAPSRSDAH